MRLSGINSGYDTESMIQAMMTSYQTKIDTQQKKLTKLSWQQEAYRDVTKKLTDFKNKYFDILKRDTYLMSPSSFTKYASKITTRSAGEDATGLKVTTTSGSLENSYKVKVDQLATSSTVEGNSINPSGFSLDLGKAAEYSAYVTDGTKDANGNDVRKYNFALDVKVGSVTKSVEFKVEASEVDGNIDMDAFRQSAVESLNKSLQDAFGFSGRTGAEATGQKDASGNEWYIQAKTDGSGKLTFDVGGNASASVSEKAGNFGLAEKSEKLAVSMSSVVTGPNVVSVTVGDTTNNVAFNGVSSTYYDSKDKAGNEGIKAEYDALKLMAYKKANKLSDTASVSQEQLDKYKYSSAQAAKDKNTIAFQNALNMAFTGDQVEFKIDGSYITAETYAGETQSFSITSVEGGTLGLTKGSESNKYSAKTSLADMGIAPNTDDGGFSLKINGKTIGLDSKATLNDLLNAVNKSDAGVTMTYSSLTNSFDLTSKDIGSSGSIDIEASAITDALGLTSGGSAVNYTAGQNAVFEINGEKIYHNSNDYTIDGTTFTFEDDIEIGETYNVGLTKSYDDIKQTIKDFVKDYNQLIDDVYGHIGTAPRRDDKNNLYEPLTDAQKDEMEEDEIEKWEKAAKQGVLYNDTTISSVMLKMRNALYTGVTMDDGKKFGLYSMGITTTSDIDEHGKLEINEDRLNAAFEKYGDEITKLFTDSTEGIMKKVDTVLDNAVRTTSTNRGSLIQRAGLEKGSSATDNYLYRQMKSITDRISTLQDRYDAKEDYWWGVFTNLESMMSDFNQQSSYIGSYFGSGM